VERQPASAVLVYRPNRIPEASGAVSWSFGRSLDPEVHSKDVRPPRLRTIQLRLSDMRLAFSKIKGNQDFFDSLQKFGIESTDLRWADNMSASSMSPTTTAIGTETE
jgi:hypothetical protein